MKGLETERLILRPWEPEDANFVLDHYSRWEVQRFIGNNPQVMRERAEAEERIRVWQFMDHPVHGVWAVTAPANRASQRVCLRLGRRIEDRPTVTTTHWASSSKPGPSPHPSRAAATRNAEVRVPAAERRQTGQRCAPATGKPPPPRPASW
jgi:RimJ/RimL family protein N-acetyltransferase